MLRRDTIMTCLGMFCAAMLSAGVLSPANAAGDMPVGASLLLMALFSLLPFLVGMALSQLNFRWLTALVVVLWGAGWLLIAWLEGVARSIEKIGMVAVAFAIFTLPFALGWGAGRMIWRARRTAKPAVTHGQ